MHPLKITFKFAAPLLVDSDHATHLDAVVAYAVSQEHESHGPADAWAASADLSAIFERQENAARPDDWLWKASAIQMNYTGPIQWVNHVRKCEPERFYDDVGVYWAGTGVSGDERGIRSPERFYIDGGSGHQRGYQWLRPTRWAREATAWAVADEAALEHYLATIPGIGKKGSNGWGRIESFEICGAGEDEIENWRLRTLAEGIDGKAGVEYAPSLACVRAPYWQRLSRVSAKEPLI